MLRSNATSDLCFYMNKPIPSVKLSLIFDWPSCRLKHL